MLRTQIGNFAQGFPWRLEAFALRANFSNTEPKMQTTFMTPWPDRLVRPTLVGDLLRGLAMVFAMITGGEHPDGEPSKPVRRWRTSRRAKQQRVHENEDTNLDLAASYGRYSTDMQSCESTSDQHGANRKEGTKNDHSIPESFEYSDEAVSGTKRERDGLNALLAAAERGEFKTVYFYNLSRLARNSIITISILRRLVYVFKVRVICTAENLDTSRGDWEFMATIIAAVNERFISDLAKSVLRGQQSRSVSYTHLTLPTKA